MDLKSDPAATSVVAALEDDPFYQSITAEHEHDVARRQTVLTEYFSYSIQEGRELGRAVYLPDPTQGVAVWLLPQSKEVLAQAAMKKCAYLREVLGDIGCSNYHHIVEYMSAKARSITREDAWYLSIIAVNPTLQGRGLGQQLLTPTLAEADAAGAYCYMETFTARNEKFYERLGFATRARFNEPTTGADYTIMIRGPIGY